MSSSSNDLSRRDFLKTAAACGAGALLTAGQAAVAKAAAASQPAEAPGAVPRRPFGKTGANVSMLALGGIFDITANQAVLTQSLKWGIDYWDTAASYTGGKSELGIGMFLGANPAERKKIFLVTKCHNGPEMASSLDTSLERMKTDYVDMFFAHGVEGAAEINQSAEAWKALVAKLKAAKKIRFFGFSTHSNMAECLQAASKLGFIDGIMFACSYRLLNNDAMKAAIEAASKAGIGLTAMKTQAKKSRSGQTDADVQLLEQFTKKGFTPAQAAVKAIWEDKHIASLCSAMYNLPVLQSNYLAALDKTQLSSADRRALEQYAQASGAEYCAGCDAICRRAVAGAPPIADVMRCLMYRDEYGMADYAREQFAALPAEARTALAAADYSAAERRCPQRMAIGELMKHALDTLA
jgi:predicted aldo/keto reductase-like oxidoreductase